MADELDDEVTGDGDKIDWKARYINQKARTKEHKERADQLDTQLRQLKPKAEAHDGLQQQLQALTRERDAEKSGRAFDRTVLAKGIGEDDLEYVQYQYNKLPEQGRPSPDVWLKDLTAEADKTPKWLSNLLPKQQAAASQSQGATQQQGTPGQQGQASQSSQQVANLNAGGQMPNPNRTAVATNGTQGAWVPTPEDRQRAHVLARQGDRSLFDRIQQADGFAPMPGFAPQGGGGQNTSGVG